MNKTIEADLFANGAKSKSQFFKFLLINPGFMTVFYYRLYSKWFRKDGIRRVFGRLLWLHAIKKTSCHISPFAEIAPGLKLPHPTGVVIGKYVKIDGGVCIYQNVTIGRQHSNIKDDEEMYAPVIGDGVEIFPGACIAGDITIGNNARIGANSVVLHDVPAGRTAVGAPARIIKPSNFDEKSTKDRALEGKLRVVS